MSAIEHTYRYPRLSSLENAPDGSCLQLAAEIVEDQNSSFFEGELLEPRITAQCLRTVSELVGKRFYTPPSMLERILREADPVVTVAQDKIRFEGFSACCSAYIRHDIGPSGYKAKSIRPGTTNVDFGPETRALLAKVSDTAPLQLMVNNDELAMAQPDAQIVERKVTLPVRWIKGFAEVQPHLAGMKHKISLTRVQLQRFLRSLPRGKADHEQWITTTQTGVRLSIRKSTEGVRVKGTQRLLLLEKLAAHAIKTDVWFNEPQGSSGWILDFGSQQLTLVLNSEPWRGFSGDGALLSKLGSSSSAAVAAVKAQLNWQQSLDPVKIADAVGHTKESVEQAMSFIATQGLLGFDLRSSTYFHRVLPFDFSLIEKLNPRLKNANRLCETGAVTILNAKTSISAEVDSGGVTHQISITKTQSTCTCPWHAKYKGKRGPCKHILATTIMLDRPE